MKFISNITRPSGDPQVITTGPSSLSAHDRLARVLGWFSFGLGLVELLAPRRLTHALGMEGQENLVRLYGAREIGSGAGEGYTANVALPAECGPETYGAAFRGVVLPMLRAYAPELILVSAGFDAHERDPLASMNLDNQTYAALASSLIDLADELGHGRIGFVLEGGYDLYALSDSVRAVTQASFGQRTELPSGKLHERERHAIEQTRHYLAPHWKLALQ